MKARRPPLAAREIRLLSLLTFGGVILVSALISVNIGLARVLPGGGGFYSPWAGSRAFLFESTEPYGPAVAGQVQRLTYGRPAGAGENPLLLEVPFHLLPAYFPLAIFRDPAVARGIWMALSEIALLGLALSSLRLADWSTKPLFLIAFLIFSCLSFYAFTALIDGGPQILLGLLYIGILFAFRNGQDEMLGALLVLACLKWEIGGLFILLVFFRLLQERRWRPIAAFGMILFILGVVSFLLYQDWLVPSLQATVASLRAYPGLTARAVLAALWPQAGGRLGWALAGLLLLILGIEWYAARAGDFRRLAWAACLTLAITPLLAFRTEMANLVVLLPGFTLLAAVAYERWARLGYALPAILLLLVFALPWAAEFRGRLLGLQIEGPIFLAYPLLTVLGLYWTRWWVVRPPRTWMDQVVQFEKR